MRIEEILRKKGHEVFTIGESESVLHAAQALVEHNIGSLMVLEGDRPIGILTERDILRVAAGSPERIGSMRVGEVMTRDLITAALDDGIPEMMDLMTARRVRHLPVLAEDRLAGIISIGDLVNACRLVAESENVALRRYIQGVG
jgi:CBS domain-containing protein